MKFIATNVDDSSAKLDAYIAAEKDKPGFSLGSYLYRSHIGYERELDRIVYKSWLYAGHVSQIPDTGDYFLYEIGEDSIIISRDPAGVIHALMNVCRHRGSRVCEDLKGNRKTFVCPYHGWVYNMDGSMRAARHMDAKADFDPADHGLKHARIVEFEGLIFINCDPDAPDFLHALKRISAALSPYDLANAKIARSHIYKVDANWKLVLENYLECYHCATSHRFYAKLHSLQARGTDENKLNKAMLARAEAVTGMNGITLNLYEAYTCEKFFGTSVYTSRYALYDGFLTGSDGGKPVAPLMGDFKDYDGGCGDFQLGPLTFMLNYPDHCVLYRFTLRSLTSTDMEIVWFVRGDAEEGVDYHRDAVTWLWHKTT